jgi:hypothetical protein
MSKTTTVEKEPIIIDAGGDIGKLRIQTDGYIESLDNCSPPCVTRYMTGQQVLAIEAYLAHAKEVFAPFAGINLPDVPVIDYSADVFLVDGTNSKLRGFKPDDLHIHIGCSHISPELLTQVADAVRKQLDL